MIKLHFLSTDLKFHAFRTPPSCTWNQSKMPELLQIYKFCFMTTDITQCSVHFARDVQWTWFYFWVFGCYWTIPTMTQNDFDWPTTPLTDQQCPWLTLTVASREPDTTTEWVKSTECTTLVWQRWLGSKLIPVAVLNAHTWPSLHNRCNKLNTSSSASSPQSFSWVASDYRTKGPKPSLFVC